MRISRMARAVVVTTCVLGAMQGAGAQGKLLVSHDEWYTGPTTMGPNEQQLIHNTLNWMNALGGSALIYSSNTFLTNSTFLSYLGTQGMTTTIDPSATSFGSYSVVFVEGNPTFDAAGLGAYVLGGGNVVYMGGTGTGGAAGESAYSAPFLNQFGIVFSPPVYNGLTGNQNTSGFASQGPVGAALFTGVPTVYSDNGSSMNGVITFLPGQTADYFLDPGDPDVFLFAAVQVVTATPEPASLALFGTGAIVMAAFARRRNRKRA